MEWIYTSSERASVNDTEVIFRYLESARFSLSIEIYKPQNKCSIVATDAHPPLFTPNCPRLDLNLKRRMDRSLSYRAMLECKNGV